MNEVVSDAAAQSGMNVAAPLAYATASAIQGQRHGTRVWAGLAVLLGGLGLIVLGGCFMIGILGLVTDGAAFGYKTSATGPPTIGAAAYGLMMVLYVLAFGCFGGAISVIVVGVRGLCGVMKG